MSSGDVAVGGRVAVAVAAQVVGEHAIAVGELGHDPQVPDGEVAREPVDHHQVGAFAELLVVQPQPARERRLRHQILTAALTRRTPGPCSRSITAACSSGASSTFSPGPAATGSAARRAAHRPALQLAVGSNRPAGTLPAMSSGTGRPSWCSSSGATSTIESSSALAPRADARPLGDEDPLPAVVAVGLLAAGHDRVARAGSTSCRRRRARARGRARAVRYGPEKACSRVHTSSTSGRPSCGTRAPRAGPAAISSVELLAHLRGQRLVAARHAVDDVDPLAGRRGGVGDRARTSRARGRGGSSRRSRRRCAARSRSSSAAQNR